MYAFAEVLCFLRYDIDGVVQLYNIKSPNTKTFSHMK